MRRASNGAPIRSVPGYARRHHVGLLALTTAKLSAGAVTATRLRTGAVGSAAVLDGSLGGPDIEEGTLSKVPAAAAADRAAVASRLASGDFNASQATVPANTIVEVSADCDQGLKAVSAGVLVSDPVDQYMVDVHPIDDSTWRARIANTSESTAHGATMYVLCTAVDSVRPPFVRAVVPRPVGAPASR